MFRLSSVKMLRRPIRLSQLIPFKKHHASAMMLICEMWDGLKLTMWKWIIRQNSICPTNWVYLVRFSQLIPFKRHDTPAKMLSGKRSHRHFKTSYENKLYIRVVPIQQIYTLEFLLFLFYDLTLPIPSAYSISSLCYTVGHVMS